MAMTRETKIGLLVGLAFIILFGIILSEKGTGRNEQLSVPAMSAFKPKVELVPPGSQSPQLTQNREDVVEKLTMTINNSKTPDQPGPASSGNPTLEKPSNQTVAPSPEPAQPKEEIAPRLKSLIPSTPTRTFSQIPASVTLKEETVSTSGETSIPALTQTDLAKIKTESPNNDDESLQTHTIQSGETLASVCRKYYSDQPYSMIKKIMELNKISKPEKILVGQIVKLPAGASTVAKTDEPKAESILTVSKLLKPVDENPVTLDGTSEKGNVKVTLVAPTDEKPLKIKEGSLEKETVKLASSTPRTYVVKNKDTLVKIAKRIYGTEKAWTKIYESNRKVISSPKSLKSGLKLKLPPMELAVGPKLND
jgi:nucleoid-associated protein YgaU